MDLRTWTVDVAGIVIEENSVYVKDRESATAELAFDLASTASDAFTHAALTQWIQNGRVNMLPEGNNSFWNAELVD